MPAFLLTNLHCSQSFYLWIISVINRHENTSLFTALLLSVWVCEQSHCQQTECQLTMVFSVVMLIVALLFVAAGGHLHGCNAAQQCGNNFIGVCQDFTKQNSRILMGNYLAGSTRLTATVENYSTTTMGVPFWWLWITLSLWNERRAIDYVMIILHNETSWSWIMDCDFVTHQPEFQLKILNLFRICSLLVVLSA